MFRGLGLRGLRATLRVPVRVASRPPWQLTLRVTLGLLYRKKA